MKILCYKHCTSVLSKLRGLMFSTRKNVLFEFKTDPTVITKLETEFKRDEKVMRFLTVGLDKYAVIYNGRRKKGEFNKKKEEKEEVKA